MLHRTASRAARPLAAPEAVAALWHPVRNAILLVHGGLDRAAAKLEGRRRAKLASFYRDVLSFVPADCAGSRRELEQEIAKLGV